VDLRVAKQVSLRTGTASEEDLFGKVAASSNSHNLSGTSITIWKRVDATIVQKLLLKLDIDLWDFLKAFS
jgi:hypothetical protein